MQRTLENQTSRAYKLQYFPFVSGEMLEEHREEIKNKLKGDYMQYMSEKAKLAEKLNYRRNSYAGVI